MPEAFDPYFKWLGIPKSDQPPHAYRLLGIELYESDADVISNAADARMAQLKSYQTGKYGAVSQKILNEIAAAKVCLLNAQKKSEYDGRVRGKLAKMRAAAAEPAETETAEAEPAATSAAPSGELPFLDYSSSPSRSVVRSTKPSKSAKSSKKPAWIVPAAIGAAVLLAAGGVVGYMQMSGSGNTKPAENQVASLPDAKHNSESFSGPESHAKPSAEATAPHPTASSPAPFARRPCPSKPEPKPSPVKPVASGGGFEPPESNPDLVASRPATNETKKPEAPTGDSSDPLAPDATKPAKPVAKKPSPPDEQQQRAMREKVLDIFKDKVKAAKSGTSDDWLALAKELDDEGDKTKDDPVARYVLWKLAVDSASKGGDLARSIDIVDKIQGQYEIDGDEMKADILTTASARAGTSPRSCRGMADTAMRLADAAVAADNLELASRHAELAAGRRGGVKDPQYNRDVISREQEIEHLKTRFAAVEKARETLKDDPDNADANAVVGAWFCLGKGDWNQGLPYLAKCSREDYADLAKRELAKPSAAKEKVALADAWWALAAKDRSDTKVKLQGRAVYWYKQAVEGLSGLEKRRVENQIAAAEAPPAAAESHAAGNPPARSFGPSGAKAKGNVALAAMGATVSGVKDYAERLLNPDADGKIPPLPKLGAG